MPSWGVHITLANRLNKKLKLGDEFIIGNVLPDATSGYIIKDIKTVIPHNKTHYNFEGENHPPKNDVGKFMEVYKDKLNNPLILGSLIHILTDNYFNEYTKKYHIDTIDSKKVVILNDGSLLDGIVPWKLKQKDFSKFENYLILNKRLGNNVNFTYDILNLSKDLNYDLTIYDFKSIVAKINSIINRQVKDVEEFKMFTLNELCSLLDSCYNYLEKIVEKLNKEKEKIKER